MSHRVPCSEPGPCYTVFPHSAEMWCEVCCEGCVGRAAQVHACKWSPGDPAVIDDPGELRHGQTVWLAIRGVHDSGKPYWSARAEPNGKATLTFPESALMKPGAVPMPDEPHPEGFTKGDRVQVQGMFAHDVNGRTAEILGSTVQYGQHWWWVEFIDGRREGLKAQNLTLVSKASEHAKPTDPAVQAFEAHMAKVKTEAPSDLAEPRPSTLTVHEGIARWQMADPNHRGTEIRTRGHSVEVLIVSPVSSQARRIKFSSPDTADRVHRLLEEADKFPAEFPDVELVLARNPEIRFIEDTGEIEP